MNQSMSILVKSITEFVVKLKTSVQRESSSFRSMDLNKCLKSTLKLNEKIEEKPVKDLFIYQGGRDGRFGLQDTWKPFNISEDMVY